VPRSRLRGAITPLPHYAFIAWCLVKTGTILPYLENLVLHALLEVCDNQEHPPRVFGFDFSLFYLCVRHKNCLFHFDWLKVRTGVTLIFVETIFSQTNFLGSTVMTWKELSWLGKYCHDLGRIVLTWEVLSWLRKNCHDLGNTVMIWEALSWLRKYCHDLGRIVLTWEVLSWLGKNCLDLWNTVMT